MTQFWPEQESVYCGSKVAKIWVLADFSTSSSEEPSHEICRGAREVVREYEKEENTEVEKMVFVLSFSAIRAMLLGNFLTKKGIEINELHCHAAQDFAFVVADLTRYRRGYKNKLSIEVFCSTCGQEFVEKTLDEFLLLCKKAKIKGLPEKCQLHVLQSSVWSRLANGKFWK